MKRGQQEVDGLKAQLVERRKSVLVRASTVKTSVGQAALQLVEEGKAHPMRAMGSGRPIWWVHCWPWDTAGVNERGVGFPYVSDRGME